MFLLVMLCRLVPTFLMTHHIYNVVAAVLLKQQVLKVRRITILVYFTMRDRKTDE